MEKENSLDNLVSSLLSFLEKMIYNKDRDSIISIDNKLNKIFKIIDKEQLITKFVQINGEDVFDRLKVNDLESYYKILPLIIKSGYSYIKETEDYLFLIAQLSIATDWYLYNKINLIIE